MSRQRQFSPGEMVFHIGAANRLLSDGTYTYYYDAEGNRTAKFIDADHDLLFDSGDSNITEYAWDNRNRLTEVEFLADYVFLSDRRLSFQLPQILV